MTRIDEKDAMHLAAMRKYLRLASLFVDGMSLDEFMDDSSVQAQLATAMAIAQVGEHVKKLSPPASGAGRCCRLAGHRRHARLARASV